jgi:hypothetical protein
MQGYAALHRIAEVHCGDLERLDAGFCCYLNDVFINERK